MGRWLAFALVLIGYQHTQVLAQYRVPSYGAACGFDPSAKLLLCYGGLERMQDGSTKYFNEVYTLSLHHRFKTASPSWQQMLNPTKMTLPVGGTNYAITMDGHFVVLGGYMFPNTSYVLDYDVAKSAWSRPPQSGSIPPRTEFGDIASSVRGRKLYLLGGIRDEMSERHFYPDLYSYQYDYGEWTLIRMNVPLEPRVHHTITAMPDDTLIVIGGESKQSAYGLEYVDVIEPISGSWKRVATKGLPANASVRMGHSAVRQGSNIFVYGGFLRADQAKVLSLPSLLILDTTTFTWSAPTLKNEPKSRYNHATFIYDGKYMITLSGATVESAIDETNYLNGGSMQILDIDTLTFVDEFDPSVQSSATIPSISNPNTTTMNTMALGLGLGLGLGGGALIVASLLFVLIRRRKAVTRLRQHHLPSQMYGPPKESRSATKPHTGGDPVNSSAYYSPAASEPLGKPNEGVQSRQEIYSTKPDEK
ncbi:uncharacterized protein VTP21DRAFT_5864 [Calcarisporiella thermophila]|uniref:uncharacterized protein n=1 Tax=Calcarisporiella thermophila TaxID=911321 RepID=UPI00374337EE